MHQEWSEWHADRFSFFSLVFREIPRLFFCLPFFLIIPLSSITPFPPSSCGLENVLHGSISPALFWRLSFLALRPQSFSHPLPVI